MANGRYSKDDSLVSVKVSSREKLRLEELQKYAKAQKKQIEELNEDELSKFTKLWEKKSQTVSHHTKLMKEDAKALAKTWQEEVASTLNDISKKYFDSSTGALSKNIRSLTGMSKSVGQAFSGQLESYLGSYSSYFSSIQTRLLGSGKTFDSVMNVIKTGLGGTQATTSLKVLENLNRLVAEGISYNVEQRAFLNTISDKIAATFDAANGTLARLIRINQADNTAAYLGMESALTEFLNKQFGDTSYLAKNMNEIVSESLIEATSQLGRNMGAEFEYVVQKWLGSLAAVGVGTGSLSKIAQGIGYVGSGNIGALSSDTELMNLLTKAATNAGLDLGQMLVGGTTPTDMNKFMSGIVAQMRTIAGSSDMVTRSQYAQLFGMTVSDLTAIMNLSSKDLVSISENMYEYSTMITRTESELKQVLSRTTVKERIENAVSNVMSAMGETITSNAVLYTTYLITDMINNAGGLWTPSIPLPFTSIAPMNISQMMESAIFAGSAIANIGTIFSALVGTGQLSLNNWGATETTGRGAGLTVPQIKSAVARSTSSIAYTGSSQTSDILGGGLAESKETLSITGQEEQSEKDLYEAVAGSGDSTNSLLKEILALVNDLRSNTSRIGD